MGAVSSIVEAVGDAVSGAVEAVGDLGQGIIDTVSDAASELDDFVNETIPGGWVLPVVVATSGALGGESLLAGAGEAAGAGAIEAGLAEGAFPGLLEGTVAADAGLGAITAPVTAGAVTETALGPVTGAETAGGIEALTPELNVGTAGLPTTPAAPGAGAVSGVEALTPELNVGTGSSPVSGGVADLVNGVPETAVGTGSSPTSGGVADLVNGTPETNVGTAGLSPTPMEPANPADFGATVDSGGITSLPTEPAVTTPTEPAATTPTQPAAPTEPGSGLTTDANQTAAETNRLLEQQANATGTPVGTTPGWLGGLADATGIPVNVLNGLAASLGIKALTGALEPGTITSQGGSYTGPLANIQYNPGTYTPYTYKPYAGGGPVESMSNANAVGANTGYPMAHMQRGSYAVPYQQPISQNVVTGSSASRVDPYTGEQLLAGGGIASLGGYSDGGQLLRGPGDGVSDSIPAMIGNKQPARLADGEFVIPARIVSELGNGSTEAGARQLYAMMDRIQAARRKTTGKNKVAANTKAAKHLPA